jgi:hypothetical protein
MTTLLRAQVLDDVPHGFTTRVGGVSPPPFDTLNFGNPGDLPPERRDPAANIAENTRRALRHAGGPGGGEGREVVEVHQVHGAAVCVVRAGATHKVAGHDPRADAAVTDDPARVVAVRTADCAPVLLADAEGRVVAAVHAGWRGVVGGVLPAAVAAMRALGGSPTRAAVGPCIGPARFEVGPEVAAEFERLFGPGAAFDGRRVVRPVEGGGGASDGKHLVDLQAALALQLLHAGVQGGEALELLPHCTASEPELFFSHRRDRGVTGRMLAFIGPVGR